MIGALTAVLYPVVVMCNIALSSCFLVTDSDAPYRHYDQCEGALIAMVAHGAYSIVQSEELGVIDDYEILQCCSTTMPDENKEDGNIKCRTYEDSLQGR
jgi:hypothetical protein